MPNNKWIWVACGVFFVSLFLPALAGAANIIWVSDNKVGTNVPADKGWVDLLKAQGYNVDYQGQGGTGTAGYAAWDTLDATKIATLNASDLIIVSRDLNSGNFANDTTEITNWNGIKKPLLLLIPHVARTDRWLWVNTATQNDVQVPLQAVKLDHPIFTGVTLDAKNQVNCFSGVGSISAATSAGNGTLIATRADNGQVWIAEWKPGQPFYSGTTQTPGGQRILFAAGATGAGGTDGTYNLTADGQRMFLNAVRYLLGEGSGYPAKTPSPADKASDAPYDVTLGWTAGKYAVTHDVYLGLSSSDVANASRTNPLAVLVSKDQSATSFATTKLQFGQTYYWRVDEVNAQPSTIFRGDVWSFTVEPYAYPLAGKSITATASSAQPGMGPEKTIDGSGLTGDLHGTDATTMWLSTGVGPNWIQYQFDQVYKLNELWVWNSNQAIEAVIGLGAKDVKIEYSTDGATWTALANVPPFARATGTATYAHNTTVNLGGIVAKYVKLTINSTWGGLPQGGLSEVRFFYVPVQARAPQPATGATGVSLDATLSWRPGREAASHKVYVATDPNAVAKGTATAQTVTDHSFSPSGLLYSTTYYWRVDEVNTVTYPGAVWSFTTTAYGLVDDFESYNDTANTIYDTWSDGVGDGKSGSQVGYNNAPFAEQTIIHGGKQSMPLQYDNSSKFSFSEATRTFAPAQNWTANGVKSLSLWFQGAAKNSGQLYVKINGTKVSYNGPATDIAKSAWIPWNIDLSTVGTSVNKVTSLTIGIEGSGSKGIVYIDDIRLYPLTPQYITPVDPGKTNLLALYTLDGDAKDSSGHNLNGTVKQGTFVASGRTGGGQALQLAAVGSVDLGNPPLLDFSTGDWALTAWYQDKMTGTADANKGTIVGKGGDNTGGKRYGLITGETTSGVVTLVTDDDVTKYVTDSVSVTNDGQWHFVVGQRAGTALQIYIDGSLEGTSTIPAAYTLSGTSQRDAYIGAMTYQPDGTLYKLFSGLIDEVHIYNKSLSQGEVLYLMGQTTPVAKPF